MSQLAVRWVAGIYREDPKLGKDFPHTFFETDAIDEKTNQFVLESYKRFNLDVVSQRIGKGFHYFGSSVDISIWREWYATLKEINFKWPPLTLRISKKFSDEIFERPVYHEAQSRPLDWSRALMHFLSKETKGQNDTNLHSAMQTCGLHKYFRCLVYKVELNV